MTDAEIEPEPLGLIPWPRDVARRAGRFHLARGLAAPPPGTLGHADAAWELLRPRLARSGMAMRAGEDLAEIRFERLGGRQDGASEAYELEVTPDALILRAEASAGFLFAAQTLRQLLPARSESPGAPLPTSASIPCLHVKDEPRYGWRGMHIDVARHFFAVDDLERLIDTMALHKFNTLHWHLTDDQGWRLEIDGWPRLTDVGGRRTESPRRGARDQGDGKPYAGWYTQRGARKLVEYAAARGIRIVPEIDLPGHMQAAIAAYPRLGHGAPPSVWTRWGISERVLNVERETIAFLHDVLAQVADIFPAPYVHLGGDECPTTEWESSVRAQKVMAAQGYTSPRQLQGWFVTQVAPVLAEAGKQAILWDEALEFEAPENTVVMVWRDPAHARAAAERGHDVIMCPESHCYFDHYQGPQATEPEAIHGFTDLRKVLAFEPGDAAWGEAHAERLLGVQGNLWSEYIHDAAHLEYMAWPRGSALAEVAWREQGTVDAEDFEARFALHARRLKAMDVLFRKIRRRTQDA